MSKKCGQQTMWLPTVIHVFLSMILLIIGLLVVNRFASGFDTTIQFKTQDLAHDLIASRLLNSGDCLAWTESYSKGGQISYLVHSGIVDVAAGKFNKSRVSQCISGKNFDVKIYDTVSNRLKYSISSGDTSDALVDTFLVRLYDSGKFSTGLITIKIK